ncbi:MAG: tungstate ABC transporter substrate-binding protein WtpA, partial [Methanoregulaceae archaeon]|nr:tungstate ABC transporter substrate-binding protein WtpA [Methanoregulaceae archaeon]
GPKQELLLATTTSLYDTGLLTYLEPRFEAMYNVDLLITSQGTGKAIELAKRGDADILMVHSPSQEMAFLEGGNGINRRTFAYNYFIIVGPSNDPAGIKGMTPENAFRTIMAKGKAGNATVAFVSRGDGSGTHSAEQNLWKAAGYTFATDVQKSGAWYVEAGKGMGETLQMASEKGAYTITDEGTYLAYKSRLNLEPLITQGAILMNVYSVMAVYNPNQPVEKIQMADNFINFMISPQTMADIGNFGKENYGKALFVPMTQGVPAGVTADFTTPATAIKPLKVYHAGSLATSFGKLRTLFLKAHPETDVQLWSGSSGSIIDKITKQNQYADVLASADTVLIPKNMYPKNASFTVDFARNAMVIMYTNQSKGAAGINASNWYSILARNDVKYATGDPTSDPGGYRAYVLMSLAEQYYGDKTIFATVVAPYSKITEKVNGSTWTIDVTRTQPDGKKLFIALPTGPTSYQMLKDGTVDYAIGYRNGAIQNGFPYVALPPEIDMSDPAMAVRYASVKVVRPSGSSNVTEDGMPIVYGVTIPGSAHNAAGGAEFVNLLITKDGQAILTADGQTPVTPAVASGTGLPDLILPNVKKI